MTLSHLISNFDYFMRCGGRHFIEKQIYLKGGSQMDYSVEVIANTDSSGVTKSL